MIELRAADSRGKADYGWLRTHHTFSFGDYRDPRYMGFRSLRVINQDIVQPGGGFPPHPHRNMEILSYIIRGSIQHRDSLGNDTVIPAGQIQRMTAGTGITHSESNPSSTEELELLQIWILPSQTRLTPGYEQKEVAVPDDQPAWSWLVSPGGRNGSLHIHQDARVLAGFADKGQALEYELETDRGAWVQVVRGRLSLNGTPMGPGDGAAASGETRLRLTFEAPSEVLLFDLK